MTLVYFCLVPLLALAAQAGAPGLTDVNSLDARRNLERMAARDPAKLSETELLEWTRARLAWIALGRLEGREQEALAVFTGCGSYCVRYAPDQEWAAVKAWGCARKKAALPCLKSKKHEKTKAQEPPQ